MRYGMVIDLSRCVGCNSCTVACKSEHGTPPGIQFHRIEKYEVGKYPAARMKFLPMLCMHCHEPPCLKVCPTSATYQREDGLVLIDDKKCMGCKYCVLACPYESRQFLRAIDNYYNLKSPTPYETLKQKDFEKGTVVKCDFCVDRLDERHLPACVETCPAQARYFGDLDDPESEVAGLIASARGTTLRQELGTGPSVYYIKG